MRLTLTLVIAILLLAVQADAQEARRKSTDELPSGKQSQAQRQQQGRRGNSQQRSPKAVFKRLDKNQDRVITPDEVPARMKNRIAKVDTDGNGNITMSELAASMKNVRQRMQGNNMPARGKGSDDTKKAKTERRRKPNGKNAEIPGAADMLARLDKNSDQVLSKDEIPARMKNRFSDMDKNGDEQLDEKELVSAVERLKAAQQSKGKRYDTDSEKLKGKMPKRPPRDG